MLQVTESELKKRLVLDNPWWATGEVLSLYRDMPPRAYLPGLVRLLAQDVRRAIIVMGPRRVGKTVLLYQAIQDLLNKGVDANRIFYVAVDAPVYVGLSLERLLNWFRELHGHAADADLYVFFDEIQYLKGWEQHLKSLVDAYPSMRFTASGSAAAALRMQSLESGAGRFTDYLVPPLSFHEFIRLAGIPNAEGFDRLSPDSQETTFIDYINFGGFPEAASNRQVRDDLGRYVADDIVDKVLLRDLPSLYGIDDTQDLKRLFTVLAYNTGQEVNLDGLSQVSGIAKNTLRKYLVYLEAAFLIHRLYRIDQNAKRFKRETHFKVYLTNPTLRAAMFGPVGADDPAVGALAETAFLAQYLHGNLIDQMHYARWSSGEIDFVRIRRNQHAPASADEIKWSGNVVAKAESELKAAINFAKQNGLGRVTCHTRRELEVRTIDDVEIVFMPVAQSCLTLAHINSFMQEQHGPLRGVGALIPKRPGN